MSSIMDRSLTARYYHLKVDNYLVDKWSHLLTMSKIARTGSTWRCSLRVFQCLRIRCSFVWFGRHYIATYSTRCIFTTYIWWVYPLDYETPEICPQPNTWKITPMTATRINYHTERIPFSGHHISGVQSLCYLLKCCKARLISVHVLCRSSYIYNTGSIFSTIILFVCKMKCVPKEIRLAYYLK